MKNIEKSKIISLAGMVEYCPGQIVSRTLAQNSSVSLTLFAFDKGEEISTHAAGGDALVTCLEGCGSVTIDGEEYVLSAGDSIVSRRDIPTPYTEKNVSKCFSP